jgi:hypothetical protein
VLVLSVVDRAVVAQARPSQEGSRQSQAEAN